MLNEKQILDLVQRIAESLTRTSEPLPNKDGPETSDGEIIGTVPTHLRHLHNLLAQVRREMEDAERAYQIATRQFRMVHEAFFVALEDQVPVPDNASGVTILRNWDVAANLDESKPSWFNDFLERYAAGRVDNHD